MNATIANVNKVIWPLKFEQLHEDCHDWLSLVDFWKYEIRFLEKAVKKYLFYPLSQAQALEMKRLFNELMTAVKPEVRRIEGWVRSFHRHLAQVANPDRRQRTLKSNTEHRRIYRKMDHFRRRLYALRGELFTLLAGVIRKGRAAGQQHRAIWTQPAPQQLRRSG